MKKKKESRQKLLKMLSNEKNMLKRLSKEMRGMRHEGMEDMMEKSPMKVTVGAEDEEGLKEGLSKAEEIMKARKMSKCK
jgi:DNA-binding transcriptional regulator of glucitol operon